MPIYEKYVNRGFTVVGVAREEKLEDMERIVKKDGYKWLNLLELKDKAGIWHKYGAGNSGGKIIMVDKNGTILAVSPSAQEIEKILNEKLNN